VVAEIDTKSTRRKLGGEAFGTIDACSGQAASHRGKLVRDAENCLKAASRSPAEAGLNSNLGNVRRPPARSRWQTGSRLKAGKRDIEPAAIDLNGQPN